MNNRILVADDEEDVRSLIASSLKSADFKILEAANGAETLELVRRDSPALIVLDLMLPGMSGLEICRVLRGGEKTRTLPIVMLTAKATEMDRVIGFEMGADDYVTKPFSPRELILRIESHLRRAHRHTQTERDDTLVLGEVVLNRTRHTVRVGKKVVEFSATEFKLLEVLMEQCGCLQSRVKLMKEVWDYSGTINTRTVDIHVRRLRQKLGKAVHIETVHGFGYRMVDPAAE